MSLASWTLLFGPSGADDDTASVVRVARCCCLVGLGLADRPRYPPCEDRLHHVFFFLGSCAARPRRVRRMKNEERLYV